jgi:hypothetical protein
MAFFSFGAQRCAGLPGFASRPRQSQDSAVEREGEAMKRLQGLAVAIALACAPCASMAQSAPDQYDDAAAAASTGVDYDDARYEEERYDEQRYEEERYDDQRYEDRHYGGGGDPRYDERYPHDDYRHHEHHGADGRYGGDCRRKPDRTTPVLGFILGGLIGNQFGHGAGRAAATAVGAHLGQQVARDAVNNCEDRYGYGYRGRGYGPSLGIGLGVFGFGHHSGYSLYFGAPFAYGYGYPGEYWRYRYHAGPWRWGHHRY